jgi:hypothetical protein
MTDIHNSYGISVLLIAYSQNSYIVIEKKTAIDNLAMMEKNTVSENQIYSIWSSDYYSCKKEEDLNSLITKYKAFKNDLNIYDLWHQTQTQDYMFFHSKPQDILRYGFPILSKQQVIASLGFGSFANQLSPTQEKDLIKKVLSFTSQLSKALSIDLM